MNPSSFKKIVLTGAPSSGKSSAMSALSQVFNDRLILVPESAVVLLSGGFPAPAHDDLEQIRAFQKTILPLQENLELICQRQNPRAEAAVLDRATLDGAGFWPLGPASYFENFRINPADEFAKYDMVLFLELPPASEFGGVSQLRFHDYQQSLNSEKQLRQVWQDHPSFIEIKAQKTLAEKTQMVISAIQKILL